MEIQALKVVIPEDVLTHLALDTVPSEANVRDLRVRVTAQGAHILGTYHMFVSMPFETFWELAVQSGKILARLAGLKVGGFGAGVVKGVLLGAMADGARQVPGLQLDGETLILDLDRLLGSRGYPVRTNLTLIQCREGSLLIESSAQP
jgi:hypothetical protein